MKIFVDVSVLTLATYVTGIQRVTREILVRMIRGGRNEIVLLHYHGKDDCYYQIDNILFVDYYANGKGKKSRMITRRRVNIEDLKESDVFFDLDAAWMGRVKRSYLLPVLKRQGVKIVAQIYDVISITHPQYCLQRGVYYFMDFLGAHLQYADLILTNAKATVLELEKISNKLECKLPVCRVLPLGSDFGHLKEINRELVPEEVSLVAQAPYILMVGTIEPRKNHKLLLDAYELGLKKMGYQIVFAGSMGWNMEDFSGRIIKHPDYRKGIYHFEGLDDNAIAFLYHHAKFLVFCSYIEGYGLPLIEGIMRGTPVIAAEIPVSREVAGDYCEWFEQDNAKDLIKVVRRFTEEPAEYERWKEKLEEYKGISWDDTCLEYEKAINQAMELQRS